MVLFWSYYSTGRLDQNRTISGCPRTLCNRSIHPEVFSVKDVLNICSKFTEVHPSGNVISIKLQSSHPEEFLIKGFLKIRSKFTVEHPYQTVICIIPCWSVISIKMLCNFIKITLQHGMKQIYRRTPMPQCHFNKVVNQFGMGVFL